MSTWKPAGPSPGGKEPERLLAALERAATRLGAPGITTLTGVFSRWEEAVGPQIAAHARPRSLWKGVLVVSVDQPAWGAQLRFMSGQVLARLREVVGDEGIVEMRVKVATEAANTPRGTGRSGR